jgi:hypothetical protein
MRIQKKTNAYIKHIILITNICGQWVWAAQAPIDCSTNYLFFIAIEREKKTYDEKKIVLRTRTNKTPQILSLLRILFVGRTSKKRTKKRKTEQQKKQFFLYIYSLKAGIYTITIHLFNNMNSTIRDL